MENLVISELIYMEEEAGEQDDTEAPIDLFDLRYTEGELLYYTRDDSVFVREHREIAFILPTDLTRARFKDPELSWQRLVIVLGLINCCIRRLVEWLADEGLRFRLLFVVGDRPFEADHPLAVEAGLAGLSLREWVQKEIVEISGTPSVADALARAGERARSVRADVVLVTTEPDMPGAPPGVLLCTLHVGDAEPVLALGTDDRRPGRPPRRGGHRGREPEGDRNDEPGQLWSAWVRTTLELLQSLL